MQGGTILAKSHGTSCSPVEKKHPAHRRKVPQHTGNKSAYSQWHSQDISSVRRGTSCIRG